MHQRSRDLDAVPVEMLPGEMALEGAMTRDAKAETSPVFQIPETMT
jgi:hypothetical protein